jgi:N-acetylated-alpha-linked acidic dipeptidase
MKSFRFLFFFAGILAVALFSSALRGQPTERLLGFSEGASRAQLMLEQHFVDRANPEEMKIWHRYMTAEPHHAGTPANEKYARYYADLLKKFGFDRVFFKRYEVLLPRPVERRIELLAPEKMVFKLKEPPIPEDPDSEKGGVLPPFNAYSADGDVTAEVVYVNYGTPEDFNRLDSLGVSVKGKIVIVRYGHSWRGIKPRTAAERGAIGCIIYSDPADDGYVRGDVIPKGKWRPEYGVQRGSVMDMPLYPGDPQTPGYASLPGGKRVPLTEVRTFQKIPVLPVSYGEAVHILKHLRGPVAPKKWRGGLPLTYHIGPGPAKVRLLVKQEWKVRPIVNVIGVLKGSDEADLWVMAGGHRDAWTFGGRDPISGAVSLLASAKMLGELAKTGHRPRRSIVIVSWDAEEYGLLGSTEFGEELARDLQEKVVVYLNRESYTAGRFGAGGVHSLQPFVNEVARFVKMPDTSATLFEAWLSRTDSARRLIWNGRTDVRIRALGSGSDYTVFLDHLGVPALDVGFSSGNGIYHSRYDSHWFFTTFGDPGFKYGVKLAEFVARFLLRMANAEILPFDYAAYGETIGRFLGQVEKEAEKRDLRDRLYLGEVKKELRLFCSAAELLQAEIGRILSLPERIRVRHRKDLRRLNRMLMGVEKAFLFEEGLPNRPWFRHQIYAPGYYTGYGVKTLPGIREAVERNRPKEAQKMAGVLAACLKNARNRLLDALEVARKIQ